MTPIEARDRIRAIDAQIEGLREERKTVVIHLCEEDEPVPSFLIRTVLPKDPQQWWCAKVRVMRELRDLTGIRFEEAKDAVEFCCHLPFPLGDRKESELVALREAGGVIARAQTPPCRKP